MIHHKDLVIIGGGSAGIALARSIKESMGRLKKLGKVSQLKSVLICDAVGGRGREHWGGVGGTCVNVGCIPKKLFKYAGQIGNDAQIRRSFGFSDASSTIPGGGSKTVNWNILVQNVQNYIKSLNFSYSSGLARKIEDFGLQHPIQNFTSTKSGDDDFGDFFKQLDNIASSDTGKVKNLLEDEVDISYCNGFARFISPYEIGITNIYGNKVEHIVQSKQAVIAVGGKAIIPSNIPGAKEFGITSNELFSLSKPPGKTLVVGASYVALECASFLGSLGYEVTLLVRSVPLRGDAFDRECADKVLRLMKTLSGVRVLYGTSPQSLERKNPGARIQVKFSDQNKNVIEESFDTVLFGTGRIPDVENLGLDKANISLFEQNGQKILVDPITFQSSTAQNIFALGDCAETRMPELTPVAIRQGEILGQYLTGETNHVDVGSQVNKIFDSPFMIPSTVFTSPEYGRIGLSEEAAKNIFGAENIETYLMDFTSLEVSAAHIELEDEGNCFVKLVCDKSKEDLVIGAHLVMPHAGEAIQGLALAIRLGCRKRDFDQRMLGIHPIDSESLFGGQLVSRSSGFDFKIGSGCGGGRCG